MKCFICQAEVPKELKARGDNGPQFVYPDSGSQNDDEIEFAFCSETCFFAWEERFID